MFSSRSACSLLLKKFKNANIKDIIILNAKASSLSLPGIKSKSNGMQKKHKPFEMSQYNHQRVPKPVRVLVLDGGGLRGCLTVQILKELENEAQAFSKNGERIHLRDMFDLIIGTSTGAGIALSLTAPNKSGILMSLDDIDSIYTSLGVDVFGGNLHQIENGHYMNTLDAVTDWIYSTVHGAGNVACNIINGLPIIGQREWASFSVKKLMKCYAQYFALEQTMLDEWNENKQKNKESYFPQTLCGIISVQANNPKAAFPVIFRNYMMKNKMITYLNDRALPGRSDLKVWEAIRATSAAPTVFKTITIERTVEVEDGTMKETKSKYLDGGLCANSPILMAFAESKTLWPNREVFVMSLGTGQRLLSIKPNDYSIHSLLSTLKLSFDSMFSGKEIGPFLALKVLDMNTEMIDLIRVNPTLAKNMWKMTVPSNMHAWRKRGKEYADEHQSEWKELACFLINNKDENLFQELE